jgi:hypothetical protein
MVTYQRKKSKAESSFGRALREIMEARGIETLGQLAVLIKKAGYGRGIDGTVVSNWMSEYARPRSIPRFCYYLDKALALTEEEKNLVARSLGWLEYPLPKNIQHNA